MQEILIINLTRMGDLLQTTPLMAGLKEHYPGSRITLLVNTAFFEICNGIPYIDELIDFDMNDYRNRLTEKKHSLVENYKYLEDFISLLGGREYDLAINITHSPISALLTSFLNAAEVRGFTIDSEGHRVIKHPWMRYFFNVIPNRIYNPFHLVDMYLKIGGVKSEVKELTYSVSERDDARASALLTNAGISKGDVLIGFHLGASNSEKTWPVSSYARLAEMIVKTLGAKIVLFGTEGERTLSEQFEEIASVTPLNLVGRTSLGELAALLGRCGLFISNDTGPLHIATSVGTRVLDISTANVHFMETGPYGEGHYVIQADLACSPCGFDVRCNDMVCKSHIQPSAVLEVARIALNQDSEPSGSDAARWENVQVYRSRIKEDGYLDYAPLVRRPLDNKTFYRILYRHVWNMETDGQERMGVEIYENIMDEMNAYDSFCDFHETALSIEADVDSLKKLVNLSGQGMEQTGRIFRESEKKDINIEALKVLLGKVESIDAAIELAGHTNPCLRPFVVIFKYSKEALEGNDLSEVSEASHAMYRELNLRADMMHQLTDRIIALMKSTSEGGAGECAGGQAGILNVC